MKFGDIELFSLSDGYFALDGGAMFGVVPRVFWQKTNPPDARNRITLGLRPLLIRTPQALVMVDTGIGEKQDQKFQDIYRVEHKSHLLESLKQAGFEPGDVTHVINTHLHFDHCGGNTIWAIDATSPSPQGESPLRGEDAASTAAPTFPNAKYVIQEKEWAMAMNPDRRSKASYLPENFMPVSEHGQLQLVSGDQEITPGVRVVLTAGHTGGHQIVVGSTSVPGTGVQNTEYRVQSTEYIEERRKTDDERRTTDQGRRTTFVYWGDLIPTASHLSIPYVMGYDTMPLVTMEQKEKLLKQALDEQWLMFFEHDPEISGGYLAEENGRYVVKGLETGDGDGRK